jgi:hypothetical protein
MAPGRPVGDFDRLSADAEAPELPLQASATLGEIL